MSECRVEAYSESLRDLRIRMPSGEQYGYLTLPGGKTVGAVQERLGALVPSPVPLYDQRVAPSRSAVVLRSVLSHPLHRDDNHSRLALRGAGWDFDIVQQEPTGALDDLGERFSDPTAGLRMPKRPEHN